MMRKALFIPVMGMIVLSLFCPAGKADIYGYQDSDGYWHFPGAKVEKRETAQQQTPLKRGRAYILEYERIIKEASRQFGVESALIKAVILTESDFNRAAVSHKGAIGLMQLMPRTVKELDGGNPFNPEENIFAGVKYLSRLLKRFRGNRSLAVAAYNAGPEKVEETGRVPPIPETKEFVQQVIHHYELFKSGME